MTPFLVVVVLILLATFLRPHSEGREPTTSFEQLAPGVVTL